MKSILIISSIALTLLACNSNNSKTPDNHSQDTVKVEMAKSQDGEALINQYCYACHKPEGQKGRLAPPMAYVKNHYLTEGMTKEEFSSQIIAFVNEPDKFKAKMRGAIGNFGVMPKQVFPEEQLKTIVEYIYQTDL